MEAFGESVIASEAPHASDFLAPGIKHIAELHQWREPVTTERADIGETATFPSVLYQYFLPKVALGSS